MSLTDRELTVARDAKGFMPDDEGLALHAAGCDGGRIGPLLEIGSYCGKSGVYLGAAARECGTVLFTIDHHRGSEENQAEWEHHDPEVVDSRTGRMDTLPFFRRTVEAAGLESVVVGVLGDSPTVGRYWTSPVGFLFIDGGHAEAVAMADYTTWANHVLAGGVLAIHDVFERPEQGGQAPFHVWQRAVADGFTPLATTGSLRTLRR
ncbi:MAG: class I SAM-dependent methyltransferase [Acidimicrobiia bacterium]|nr:class I SAM-dependent methyltransferase [Acidimicrobiia bacterium]